MSLTRKFAALPLAVIISFGAAGCSSLGSATPENTTSASSSSSSQNNESNVADSKNGKAQIATTMNEALKLAGSDEYTALISDMSEVPKDASLEDIKAVFAKHDSVAKQAKGMMEMTDDAVKDYIDRMMESATEETPLSKDFEKPENREVFEQMTAVTFIYLMQNPANTGEFNVVDSEITETDSGLLKMTKTGGYFTDENGGITAFYESPVGDISFSKDGSKVSLQGVIDSLDAPMASESEPVVSADATLFSAYKSASSYPFAGTAAELAETLNKEDGGGNSYESVEKNGKEYIKVTHPDSELAKKGDVLYAFDKS